MDTLPGQGKFKAPAGPNDPRILLQYISMQNQTFWWQSTESSTMFTCMHMMPGHGKVGDTGDSTAACNHAGSLAWFQNMQIR